MRLTADTLNRGEKSLSVGRIHGNAANKWTSGTGALGSDDRRRAGRDVHESVVFGPGSATIVRSQNTGTVKAVEREIFLARAVIDRASVSTRAVAHHRID